MGLALQKSQRQAHHLKVSRNVCVVHRAGQASQIGDKDTARLPALQLLMEEICG